MQSTPHLVTGRRTRKQVMSASLRSLSRSRGVKRASSRGSRAQKQPAPGENPRQPRTRTWTQGRGRRRPCSDRTASQGDQEWGSHGTGGTSCTTAENKTLANFLAINFVCPGVIVKLSNCGLLLVVLISSGFLLRIGRRLILVGGRAERLGSGRLAAAGQVATPWVRPWLSTLIIPIKRRHYFLGGLDHQWSSFGYFKVVSQKLADGSLARSGWSSGSGRSARGSSPWYSQLKLEAFSALTRGLSKNPGRHQKNHLKTLDHRR